MAIWAEIKKTINDDFSTPLNKLIESVRNQILASNLKYKIKASDTVRATIINSEVSRSGSVWGSYGDFLVLRGSGYIKFTFSVKSSSGAMGYYQFYRNGVEIEDSYTETQSTSYVTKTVTFFVNENDLISFKMRSNSTATSYIAYCKLLTASFDLESYSDTLEPEIVII